MDRDVGRGIARADHKSMDSLTASTGDVIEIRGKRRTVAKCLPLTLGDRQAMMLVYHGSTKDHGIDICVP